MTKQAQEHAAARASPSAARALLALQIGLRLLTFVLNQVLVRTTPPAVFGAANVQLELVLSTVLSLSRDGVRAIMMRHRESLRKHGATRTPCNRCGWTQAFAPDNIHRRIRHRSWRTWKQAQLKRMQRRVIANRVQDSTTFIAQQKNCCISRVCLDIDDEWRMQSTGRIGHL